MPKGVVCSFLFFQSLCLHHSYTLLLCGPSRSVLLTAAHTWRAALPARALMPTKNCSTCKLEAFSLAAANCYMCKLEAFSLTAAASDQRVVSISGREEAQAQASPAIDALMYCAAPVIQEEGDPQKCVRLVVPSSQVRTDLPCGACH